jgi:hypothetical protein
MFSRGGNYMFSRGAVEGEVVTEDDSGILGCWNMSEPVKKGETNGNATTRSRSKVCY